MASPGSVVIQFLVDAKKAARDAADLAKNFGKVDSEADDLDSTLSGLEAELDSIGRETASLKQDMGKAGVGFDGVGDDAEQAADRVRRAARDMADGVHDGGTKIDVETDGIRTSMGETGKEAGAEFIGNMAEGIGSGTGTIADTVQGTLGGLTNLAASIGGPIGLAAGAAAAGVGLVFAKVKAESEKAAAEVEEMIDLLWEVGSTTSEIAKQKIWENWQSDLQEDKGLMDDLANATRVAGITADEMQGAITGDPAAQKAVVDKLKAVGKTLADNVLKGKPLTADQREYLSNQGRIHEALRAAGIEIGKAADAQSDLEQLTGNTARAAADWADDQRDVYNQTHKIRDDMEVIKGSHDVNFNVLVNGKKVSPGTLGKLDPGTWAAPPNTGPAPAGQATLTTVNVYTSGPSIPNTPRAVRALLDSHDLRMGRRPGTPRAVAW